MAETLREVGNPSSVHGFGRRARARLEQARRTLAEALGAAPAGVVFTSGGTEANQLALAQAPAGRVIAVSAIEHASIAEAVPDALRLPVTGDGVVDLAAAERLIREQRPALVSVMLANNETGVVQPVGEAARIARAAGALVHGDAVQAFGKVPLALPDLGVDLLTVSAHKVGGPAGVGALVVRDGLDLVARQPGGGQERRRRAGTENLAGIVGFARAVELLPTLDRVEVRRLRDRLEAGVRALAPEARVIGEAVPRLPNTTCLVTPGLAAETQLMALDLAGIAVSSGSACSSGKVGVSHVLLAIGLGPELARCAIRVSLGWSTTEADIERFLAAWETLYRRTRRRQPPET